MSPVVYANIAYIKNKILCECQLSTSFVNEDCISYKIDTLELCQSYQRI